jgi:RNA recognition motif-containing protein
MKDKTMNKELFVTDISFDVEEEDLRKLFAVCGTVRSIHLLTDKKTGKFTGCAFVKMTNAAEAKDAINMLDGARLINRCISVKAAQAKKDLVVAAPGAADKPRRTPRSRGRRK